VLFSAESTCPHGVAGAPVISITWYLLLRLSTSFLAPGFDPDTAIVTCLERVKPDPLIIGWSCDAYDNVAARKGSSQSNLLCFPYGSRSIYGAQVHQVQVVRAL